MLSVLHYDNRADPTAYVEKLDNYAWDTTFDAAALRVETARGWTMLLQWLDGRTVIEPNNFHLQWDFNSRSAMLGRTFGHHMLTARYDAFEVEMGSGRGRAMRTGMPGLRRMPSSRMTPGGSCSSGCGCEVT